MKIKKCKCGIDYVLLDGELIKNFAVEVLSLSKDDMLRLHAGEKVKFDVVRHFNHRRRKCKYMGWTNNEPKRNHKPEANSLNTPIRKIKRDWKLIGKGNAKTKEVIAEMVGIDDAEILSNAGIDDIGEK